MKGALPTIFYQLTDFCHQKNIMSKQTKFLIELPENFAIRTVDGGMNSSIIISMISIYFCEKDQVTYETDE